MQLLAGLIDDYEHAEIDLVRKIRNEFAHSIHGVSFESERIKGLCSTLSSDLPKGGGHKTGEPRFRFVNAVVCLVGRLYYRPEWVALERRTPKIWVSEEESGWRAVTDELPPEGLPVIVLGKPRR